MVHRHQQHVLVCLEAQQRGPQQGARGEVEGAQGLCGSQAARFGLARVFGQVAQVDDVQRHGGGWGDDLDGGRRVFAEGGAQ